MPRSRKKEKMLQPSITEYFTERKLRKRTTNGFKDNEKLSKNAIPRKVVILDANLDSTKETKEHSSNSSKLLISVLQKQTKLQDSIKKVSRNENNNPNLKVITICHQIHDLETISPPSNKINLTTEKAVEKKGTLINNKLISLEKENESTKEVPTSVKSEVSKDSRKNQIVKILKSEKNIKTPIPKKLQANEIPDNKVSKTVTFHSNIETSQSSKTTTESNLPLPKDYEFLGKVFTCVDSVSMMLHKRGEIITFGKLQPALQNMSDENVTSNHLAQIQRIYPEAYSFRREMLRISDSNKPLYEFILDPTFKFSEKTSESNLHKNVLLSRKETFYNKLLERVKGEHEKFLKENSKSGSAIRKVKINCWHPNFDIEKCKPIELSDLPVFHNIKITSPKQFLEKVMECLKAETNLKRPTETQESVPKQEQKNVNQDYYRRLPTVAKIIRNIFLSQGKNVLALSLLTQKLQISCNLKLTIAELEKHIRFLCQFVPKWISLFNLGKTDRLKIDKKIPFPKVLKILEDLTKKK